MVSIPKFSNPYNLESSVQKCTRREIFGDSDGKTFSNEDAATKQDLEWLEESLRSSFVYQTQEKQSERSTRRHPGVERAERARNRQKTVTEPPGFDQSTGSEFDFRLLSGSRHPGKISTQPKPPQALRRIQREYEDTPEHSEERARRAKEVAVDSNWVLAQSQISFPKTSRRDGRKLETIALSDHSPSPFSSLPNVLVTECLKKIGSTGTSSPRIRGTSSARSSRFSEDKARPSPHGLRGRLCCSLVPIRKETPDVQRNEAGLKRRRKRGVPQPRRK